MTAAQRDGKLYSAYRKSFSVGAAQEKQAVPQREPERIFSADTQHVMHEVTRFSAKLGDRGKAIAHVAKVYPKHFNQAKREGAI